MGEIAAGIAELVVYSTDWSCLQEIGGTAQGVGAALLDLLAAPTSQMASDAYWRIENHVVVQGELYQAAEVCTAVLVAAFADERPRHVRICALDLLFQILSGSPSPTAGTPSDLLERCQSAAREGLWGLVREAVSGEHDAAWEVLERIGLGERFEILRAEVIARRTLSDN